MDQNFEDLLLIKENKLLAHLFGEFLSKTILRKKKSGKAVMLTTDNALILHIMRTKGYGVVWLQKVRHTL